jgi:hypothetical protein
MKMNLDLVIKDPDNGILQLLFLDFWTLSIIWYSGKNTTFWKTIYFCPKMKRWGVCTQFCPLSVDQVFPTFSPEDGNRYSF